METIGKLIQKQRQTHTPSTNSSSTTDSTPALTQQDKLTPAKQLFLQKYQSLGDVEQSFSPQRWSYAVSNPKAAYTATCPTMQELDTLYGPGSSAVWIYHQITALYGASSSKDPAQVNGIGIFAENFAREARGYKLSEMMLFFGRYKAGRYDDSYSIFDTRRIGNAVFHGFIPHRRQELESIERIIQQEQAEKRRSLPEGYSIPQGYNPWTWHQEQCKQRGEKPLFQ